MRRRRRNRFGWMPINGSTHVTEESPDSYSTDAFGFIGVNPSGAWSQVVITLAPDHNLNPNELSQNSTLGDVVANEWVLRRIVGNFVALAGTDTDAAPTLVYPRNIQVVAGFFVARADPDADNEPVGYSSMADPAQAYNPGNPATAREPWIWRRRWVLSPRTGGSSFLGANSIGSAAGEPASQQYTTTGQGTMRTGSDIDQRTMRRIGNDERLFFTVGAQRQFFAGNPTGTITGTARLFWTLDYRLLGALRKARQHSAF